jgi:hypothetical protein
VNIVGFSKANVRLFVGFGLLLSFFDGNCFALLLDFF